MALYQLPVTTITPWSLGAWHNTEFEVVMGNQMVLADQIQKSFANDIEEHSSMK